MRLPVRAAAILSLILLALAPCSSWAAPNSYVVVPERSQISFHYTENGVERGGEFEKFTGSGTFDPDAPGQSELKFAVESRSIELGNALVEEFAQTREWFDSERNPHITFRLTRLEPLAGERYIAEGLLGIRGRERAVSAPVRLSFGAGEVEAEGDLRVDRRAYRLGTGASQAFVDIGREVSVRFRLVARPAG